MKHIRRIGERGREKEKGEGDMREKKEGRKRGRERERGGEERFQYLFDKR